MRHGDQLEGVFVWKKQKRDRFNKAGLKSGELDRTEKRGHQKHLRMKERKKMSLSIVLLSNSDMKAELWEVIAST